MADTNAAAATMESVSSSLEAIGVIKPTHDLVTSLREDMGRGTMLHLLELAPRDAGARERIIDRVRAIDPEHAPPQESAERRLPAEPTQGNVTSMHGSGRPFSRRVGVQAAGQDLVTAEPAKARWEKDFHIYGRSGALTVKAGDTRKEVRTVYFDAALSKGDKVFDWENKIVFMFTPDELLEVLCVLTGLAEEASFKAHGEDKKKWLSMKRQEKAIFVQVGDGGEKKTVSVPVSAADAFRLTSLIVETVSESFHTPIDHVLTLLKTSYAPFR